MSLLLIIEDKRGKEPFKILAQKILNIKTDILRMQQGDMFNIRKVASLVRSHCSSHRHVAKVIVCRDSECTPISETQSLCRDVENSLNRQLGPRFPSVVYIVVDHSLEGWLASDKQALRQVLGQNANIPTNYNAEDDCRPADKLDDIFTQNGRDGYEKSRHAIQLAQACDPEIISRHSATFRYFQKAIRGH